MGCRLPFSTWSRQVKGIGAAAAATGMIAAALVTGPFGTAHAGFSCDLNQEHQANSDHFECHFVHVEVHGAPTWNANINFFRNGDQTNPMGTMSVGDLAARDSRTLTWDCAREPVQSGEWPCTGSYHVHVEAMQGNAWKPNNTADADHSLTTNHCYVVKAMGDITDAGTSWESCNTN